MNRIRKETIGLPKACLETSNLTNSERFLRQTRQNFAGLVGLCQEILTRYGAKSAVIGRVASFQTRLNKKGGFSLKRMNICKIIAFFVMAFVLSTSLTPASAAADPISKPVRMEQLSDGGGFFVLTFQDKIHSSLPGFSFDIYAIPIGKGANYQARRIIVTETATKNVVQEIPVYKLNKIVDYPSTSDWETMGFVIEDMNFDGYKDIRIVAFMPGGSRIPYFYWFWDNKEQKFVRNTDLEEITAPVFDPVNKTIRSSASISGTQSYDLIYKYVNSVPITKENYLKSLLYLEQMEANLKYQNNAQKKKTLNNCFKGWNEELNNILAHLTKEARPEAGEILKASQKDWLADREKIAKEAGSMQPDNYSLAYTHSLVQSTKNRAMALIEIFFDGEKK